MAVPAVIPPPLNAEQPNIQANQPNVPNGGANIPNAGANALNEGANALNEGANVLKAGANVPKAGANVPKAGANVPNEGANQPVLPGSVQPNPDAVALVPAAPGAPGAPKPGVRTLSIKVTDGTKAAAHVLPLPNEALAKLLESISTSSLTKGSLPTFTDRALASLTTSYATTPGSGTFTEPADITEKQWDSILKNNRALHGYWYDWDLNILVKASKKGRVEPQFGNFFNLNS